MLHLENVRAFDGNQLLEPGTVVIGGPVLGPVLGGDDTSLGEHVDGRGGVLLPGLIDAHVHLRDPDDLTMLAGWGITTALDMACWPPEHLDALRGYLPDIRSAGTPAIGAGGPHARMPGMPREAILTSADQTETFVAKRVAEGSDHLKKVAERPGPDVLDQATIDAVAAAARGHGKRSVAHASSVEAFRVAVRAGVDVVTHVPLDGVLDEETAARMATQGQVAVPTLAMMEAIVTGLGRPGGDFANARDSVSVLHAAGCRSSPGPTRTPRRPRCGRRRCCLPGTPASPTAAGSTRACARISSWCTATRSPTSRPPARWPVSGPRA